MAPGANAPRVLMAGGGSGGHVFPALAVGGELARRGWQVDYTGAAEGMEARLVGERGLPFHPLPARPLVGRGPLAQAGALWTLLRSAFAARALLRRLGVRAVVGTGGYASAPALVGAWLAHVPALLVEPNAVPGVANRLLSRLASDAAIAFDSASEGLACGAALTGVPVRPEFAALAAEAPGGPRVRLLVAGGSQGAEQLNRLVPEALGRLRAAGALPPLAVLHQAGRGKVETTRAAYEAAGLATGAAPPEAAQGAAGGSGEPGDGAEPVIEVRDFVADMAAEIGAAHLVISRAGAITTAEICAAGRASLLVPLTLAGGHQMDNARQLAAAGAAEVLGSGGLGAEALAATLGRLLGDRERLAAMAASARRLGRPDAAAAIADRVEALAAGREAA
ncbi:MAG TPA: UDP-N-acetylglucosamine--N-acetylmuramyl-(pentapeptide) pyrophosphoryl-undecaprenol N-acetylglucosamine transferase [Thermoanaerobaculia bacterium]|nr:UDP-N-acetylglucosamine--N-acetylmuramyl-(pentapeptide) pyrophosphoryl-undecaprenol N-acetylglucosamine transferase [Thermoanaerobaculia bacterium]